jgi:hypothetical protein
MLSSATLGRPTTSRRQTSGKQEGLLGSIGRFYVFGSVYALGAEGSGRAGRVEPLPCAREVVRAAFGDETVVTDAMESDGGRG